MDATVNATMNTSTYRIGFLKHVFIEGVYEHAEHCARSVTECITVTKERIIKCATALRPANTHTHTHTHTNSRISAKKSTKATPTCASSVAQVCLGPSHTRCKQRLVEHACVHLEPHEVLPLGAFLLNEQ